MVYVSVCVYVSACVCVHVCVHACVCVCVCVCVTLFNNMYMYMYSLAMCFAAPAGKEPQPPLTGSEGNQGGHTDFQSTHRSHTASG